MKPIIGIIGIKGKYGQWLKKWFERLGYDVIGSDIDTELTNQEVVEQAQIIIFSVPINLSVQIILEVNKSSRPDQLFMDITGLKQEQIKAMLQSQAEVVGLHPMCAPTVESWKGQTVVICPARLSSWQSWLNNFLKQTQASVKELSPDQHDSLMSVVQCMVHAVILNMAGTIRSKEVDVGNTLEVASPFYRIALSLMGRILAQDPENYANMQICNPHTLIILKEMEDQLKYFREIVESGDTSLFQDEFAASAKHLGQDNITAGFDLFQQLIRLMADMSEENSLTLEFSQSSQDSPGVLAQIATIFASNGINFTSFHSFAINGKFRFVIGLDRRKNSPGVTSALKIVCNQIKDIVPI